MALSEEEATRIRVGVAAFGAVTILGMSNEAVRGTAAAWVKALSAVIGVEQARSFINELLPQPVPQKSKPRLVFDRESVA